MINSGPEPEEYSFISEMPGSGLLTNLEPYDCLDQARLDKLLVNLLNLLSKLTLVINLLRPEANTDTANHGYPPAIIVGVSKPRADWHSGVGPYYLPPDYHKRLQYDAIKSAI